MKKIVKSAISSILLAGIFIVSKPIYAQEEGIEPMEVDTTVLEEETIEETEEITIVEEVIENPTLIEYSTYEKGNWSEEQADGQTSGTIKKKTPIEGISIELGNSVAYEGGVEYRAGSLQSEWTGEILKDGQEAGVTGESNYLEVLQMRLFGEVANYYDVYYRVYAQGYGWLGWARNWELAGTHGKNKYLEGLQIQLIEKEKKKKPSSRSKPYLSTDGFTGENYVSYQTYNNKNGWTSIKYDGKEEGLTRVRFEALSIDKSCAIEDVEGDILYKSYIADVGWEEGYSKNGEISGTEQGLRVERIQVGLSGELSQLYDIYYRIYVVGKGWLSWAVNFEEAGTLGYSNRLEKIQILLVSKGGKAPGLTSDPLYFNKVNYAQSQMSNDVKGKYGNHYEGEVGSTFSAIQAKLSNTKTVNLLKKEEIDDYIQQLKDLVPLLTYKSGSAATVFISTDSGKGNSLKKANGYITTTLAILDTEGNLIESSGQVKVRGNSTSYGAKKPFTIKFDSKQNVLGMGKAKKWALLANCYDPTGLRNNIALDLAQEMGLNYTSEHEFVEVYIDGIFKGMYLLVEPIEEGKNRVDIDLEAGEFLIEQEATRSEAGGHYIVLNNGLRYSIKEPEEMTKQQIQSVKNTMNNILNIMKKGTLEEISEVVDIESFSKYYLFNEYVKTIDINFSSIYFYYKGGKLYAGPAWDYDISMGNNFNKWGYNNNTPVGWTASRCGLFRVMCKNKDFMNYTKIVFQKYAPYMESMSADNGLIDQCVEKNKTTISHNLNEAGWNCAVKYSKFTVVPQKTYEANIQVLKTWLHKRYQWLYEQFGQ